MRNNKKKGKKIDKNQKDFPRLQKDLWTNGQWVQTYWLVKGQIREK